MTEPQPTNSMPHTTEAVKELNKEFESGAYHPDNIDVTEIDNLSGPAWQEVAVKIAPEVLHDAYEADPRTQEERTANHQENAEF